MWTKGFLAPVYNLAVQKQFRFNLWFRRFCQKRYFKLRKESYLIWKLLHKNLRPLVSLAFIVWSRNSLWSQLPIVSLPQPRSIFAEWALGGVTYSSLMMYSLNVMAHSLRLWHFTILLFIILYLKMPFLFVHSLYYKLYYTSLIQALFSH